MKKNSMFFLFLIALTINTTAQIPNNGFENWATAGNCLQPQGWAGINDWLGLTENCYGMSRSTDHYPASIGSYSIKIENNTSILPDPGAYGLIWSGDSTGRGTDQPVFPITGKPASLCGYYKFTSQNGDSMRIFIMLYKNGTEVSQAGLISLVSVAVWTPFTISIPAYTDADSARIMISTFNADKIETPPHGNSVLYIDNLSFDNLISSLPEQSSENALINLFPNPTQGRFTINSNRRLNSVIVQNMLGEIIYTIPKNGSASNEIDLSDQPKGIYFVKVYTGERSYSEKLVVK